MKLKTKENIMPNKFKLSMLTIALVCSCTLAFASFGIKVNGTPKGARENINITTPTTSDVATATGVTLNLAAIDSSLFVTGTANGGATSVASTTTACPTGFAFVRKVITSNSDPLFTAGTLGEGKPGQILTVYVAGLSPTGATTGGNYTITPTTTTGFTSIKLTAVNDTVTFEYVNSTIGWVIIHYAGTVTITLKA